MQEDGFLRRVAYHVGSLRVAYNPINMDEMSNSITATSLTTERLSRKDWTELNTHNQLHKNNNLPFHFFPYSKITVYLFFHRHAFSNNYKNMFSYVIFHTAICIEIGDYASRYKPALLGPRHSIKI